MSIFVADLGMAEIDASSHRYWYGLSLAQFGVR